MTIIRGSGVVERSGDRALRVDHLQAGLLGRSLRGGAVTFGAQGVKVAVQFGAVMILSRLLPPQSFGLLAMVAALTEVFEQIKDFGLSSATIQRPDITHEQVTALFWINSTMGAAAALLLFASAPLVAQFYGQPDLIDITRWLALAFVISGVTTQHWAILRRQMRFNTMASIDVGCELLGMATAVVAALAGAGYWALVGQRLASSAAMMFATWSTSRWRPSRPRRCSGIKPLLAFGASVAGNGIINILSRNIDQVLIGWYWGTVPLGLYERGYKLLMNPINTVTVPLYSVGMPALSRLYEDSERYRRAYVTLSERLAMLTVPSAALMVVSADWIVALLLGPQWHGTAPIVAWLGLAAAISPVCVITGLLFLTQGRASELPKVGALNAVVNVAAILIGLPFGPVGVAAAFAMGTTFVRVPMCFWLAGRRGPVTAGDLCASVVPSTIAACAVFAALIALRQVPQVETASPVMALPLCACLVLTVSLICFGCIPRSRRVLLSIARYFSGVLGDRKARA
jgi:polysaccharide transporter, PST family